MKQAASAQQDSLAKRSLRAGGWSFAATFSTYALRLISNLIMTRLLMPEAFGMLAMAVVVLTALNLMTDIGISQSVIREKDGGDAHFLRVAWVVKLIRSVLIALMIVIAGIALWFLGPIYAPADSVYARPEMPGLILLTALSPVLAGLTSTSLELASREMNYKSLTLFGIISQIISTICMVLFAQISATVWALMAGMLVANVLLCLFSHTFLPGPRMRLEWDQEISNRLWKFGKWILASSGVWFVANNADKLIMGALIGSTTFGIFTIAQIWIEAGKQFIAKIEQSVGFPAIAEVYRERPEDVPRLFRKFQTAMDGICILGFLTLLLGGPLLIETLYSNTYHEAGRYLQIFSLTFLVVRFNTLMGLVLNIGNSKAMLGKTSIIAIAVCVGVPLCFSMFGIEGAVVASALAPGTAIPYILYHSKKILGMRQTWIDITWAVLTVLCALLVI